MVNSQPPKPNPKPNAVPTARPRRRRNESAMPWRMMGLSLLLYAIAGLLLAAFSPPYWVWPLALVGTLLQCLTLAGPQSLLLLSRWKAWWAVRVSCIGSAALLVAVAIATGFGGTNDIDTIELRQTAFNIVGVSLGSIVLVFACTLAGARTGDQLVALFGRGRSGLMLTGVCFLGLFIGGLIGIAAIPQG
ncbi:MAG: hypothetical protein AAFR42_18670 [Cyanobacteria bacterium J06628_6]